MLNKVFPDYVFNKWVFRSAILLMLILFLVGFGLEGFQNRAYLTLSCPSGSGMCKNPFYVEDFVFNPITQQLEPVRSEDYSSCPAPVHICNMQFLPEGFNYTQEPNKFLKVLPSLYFLIIAFAFLFNHLVFNKARFKK